MRNNFKDLFGKAILDVNRELMKSELRKSSVYANTQNRMLNESMSERWRNDSADGYIALGRESIAQDEMPVLINDVKREIRRIFEKYGKVNETISCHPDFSHLENTQNQSDGYAITMFFDIAGSIKLGKIYGPSTTFNIKNTVIKYVIEIIQAFDGHVHRIMGDAVMAFFRSNEKAQSGREIDSAIDAINAGIYILEFMEQVVRPALGDAKAEHPIGVRIGIDYAKKNEIVWGNYGVSGAFEVTATSYNVDVAAKLQQAAGTDNIMIGENMKELLGLGDEYLSVPFRYIKDENGNEFRRAYPYVRPNYRVRGEQINYRQYVLDNKTYFRFLPYGLKNSNICVSLTAERGDVCNQYLCPCSESLDKGMSLTFHITYTGSLQSRLTVKSVKQNTGPDARAHNATSPVTRIKEMQYYNGAWHADVSESTRYHGLHHMKLIILDEKNNELDETVFSLYIR